VKETTKSNLKYKRWGQQITDGVELSRRWACDSCLRYNMMAILDPTKCKIIGLTTNFPVRAQSSKKTYAVIVECQNCFDKFWFHCDDGSIDVFLDENLIPQEVVNPNYPAEK
jgi:hypothetical protein